MALLRDFAQGLPFGVGNAIKNYVPTTGLSYILGQTVGSSLPGGVKQAVFGTATPGATYANETPTVPKTTPNASVQNASFNPNGFTPPSTVGGNNGGGGGSSVGNVPSGIQNIPSVEQGVPSPDTGAFDAIINPVLQALEGGIGTANSAYGAAQTNIEANYGKQVGQAQANTQESNQQLAQRQTQAESGTKNAVAEAQRSFAEMSQGLQARYGGTTGTGGFAESILGGQTQRNIAGYQQQLSQSIQQIADTKQHVKLVGDQLLQDLESQKQASLSEAKAQLDQTIQNIRMKQGELQSRKAELVQGAIQNYQQQLAQANQLDTQFKQQLYQQQMTAEQKLASAASVQQQKLQQLQIIYAQGSPVGVFNPNQQPVNGVGSQEFGQLPAWLQQTTKKPDPNAGTDELLY